MFEHTDNLEEFGTVPARKGMDLKRVAFRSYRWTLIQFAKFVLVQFDIVADGKMVEEAVDLWLTPTERTLKIKKRNLEGETRG